jgi:hypothetical protein
VAEKYLRFFQLLEIRPGDPFVHISEVEDRRTLLRFDFRSKGVLK